MKHIYYSAITGPDHARQMGEIMEAPHGEEWDGDTASYLENLDPTPAYREGPQHIPGDIMQHFTATPANICVVFSEGEPREIYWSDTADKPAKKSYDLILTSKGPTPMRAGTHEEISGLSLSPYDPNNYIIHESPRAIYRIHKLDAEKSDIKRFLQRADKLPPRK
jgi:hypothetical protein